MVTAAGDEKKYQDGVKVLKHGIFQKITHFLKAGLHPGHGNIHFGNDAVDIADRL